jgi:hypothetical protein
MAMAKWTMEAVRPPQAKTARKLQHRMESARNSRMDKNMKRMGIRPMRFPGKKDCHPPKGYVNFWESEMKSKNGKSRERRESKRANVRS